MKRSPRERLAARRAALQARLRAAKRPERRRPWWLLLVVLLLLVLAWLCCCSGPVEEVVEVVVEPAPAAGPPTPTPPPEPPPEALGGRVERRDRPGFTPPAPDVLPWLATFRLQVTARSPRLAQCFVGVARPGRLKWTAEVEPTSGRVSDHTLESTLSSDPLTAEQRACVLAALSEPPYDLPADGRATPSRVGIAIEF